jgi:exodeoxyribonuclease-3
MPTRIASVNVNGVRAAFRKGMGDWLGGRGVDILCLQEVRAETTDLLPLLGDGWHVVHDAATAKGRAGVAIASRTAPTAVRTEFGPADFDSAGRWIEADFAVGGSTLTVASAYVHSGEVNTPKQVEKYKFLEAFEQRLAELSKGEARAPPPGAERSVATPSSAAKMGAMNQCRTLDTSARMDARARQRR